jgi:hypothetical protein
MRLSSLFALLCSIASSAFCQTEDWAKTPTPAVLSITTEVIKEGQEDAHVKIESGWRRAFTKVNYPSYFLGISSLTGPSAMLFLTGYDSLEAWQKDDEDQGANQWLWTEQDKLHIEDSVYVSARNHEYAELVPELTVPTKFPLGAARCFSVTRIDVEPSQSQDVRNWLRRQIAAKAAVLTYLATYRLFAGGSPTTYIVIEARTSRGAYDSNRLDLDFPPTGVKGITRNLFEPDPNTSHVTREFAKGNERFWFAPED